MELGSSADSFLMIRNTLKLFAYHEVDVLLYDEQQRTIHGHRKGGSGGGLPENLRKLDFSLNNGFLPPPPPSSGEQTVTVYATYIYFQQDDNSFI